MSKLIVLNLGRGSLYEGFSDVTVQIGLANDQRAMEFRGSLPPAPDISQLYQNWQLLYSALYQHYGWNTRLEVVEDDGLTNFSEVEFNILCEQLLSRINAWLNSEEFRKIDQVLRMQLDPNEEIHFIISTGDNLLRRLPWHLWSFFEDYPNAQVGLSSLERQRPSRRYSKNNKDNKVKILAFFGSSEGIDISKDKYFLEKLSGKAKINFLIEPQRKELSNELWTKGWDILFFAGHSYSQETGVLQINKTTTITLDKLKHGLKKAIENGLRLVIFNSCDGLGLAEALEELHIPHVIVMREPVPDLVAQEFLKHFLTEFSSGKSLYSSLREARKRLEGIEDEFPCATWLPIICHNPLEPPMIWKQHRKIITYKSLRAVFLTSLLVTTFLMGVRYFGFLQTSEIQAFDRFMQLRSQFVISSERGDKRLLIVTIDEQDIEYQNDNYPNLQGSLSDEALAELLKKLNPNQTETIGLDLHRTHQLEQKDSNFVNPYENNRLFIVCKAPTFEEDGETDGIRPLQGVPKERTGFSDLVADEDGAARRHLLMMNIPETSDSQCVTEQAFSLRLALNYLNKKGKMLTFEKEDAFQIGDVVFKRLKKHSSGYQNVDARGYQVLLNYRSLPSVDKIADTEKLRNILDKEKPLERVRDRVVLIGRTSATDLNLKDAWKTPFSYTAKSSQRFVPGVFVQAQMVSQILSSVLDDRPLFWWLNLWVEVLWVWGWSFIGGAIAWSFLKPLYLGIAVTVTLFTLFAICFGIFLLAGWIPLIPTVLALLATQVVIVLRFKRLYIQSRNHLI